MMQWIIEQWHSLAAGGGALSLIGGVVAMVSAGRKRAAALVERDTAIAPALLERVSRLEQQRDDVTGRFESIRGELDDCKRSHEECGERTTLLERRVAERDDAIEELQQQILRGGKPIRHRITPRDFPALDGVDKDRWDE